MSRIILTAVFVLCSISCFSQTDSITFFNYTGKKVSKDSADFVRFIARKPNPQSLYTVTEYYINGNKKLIGESTVAGQIHFNGKVMTFDEAGKREGIFEYRNGVMHGDQYSYYPNGQLKEIRNFPDNIKDKTPFKSFNYIISAYFDSAGTKLVTNGTGLYRYSTRVEGHEDFLLNYEGRVLNNLKTGDWKGTTLRDTVELTEVYDEALFKSGTAKFKDNITTTYTVMASWPAYGEKKDVDSFFKYIYANVSSKVKRKCDKNGYEISFVVEKDGSVTHVVIIKSIGPEFDKELIRAVEASAKWQPGTLFGRVLNTNFKIGSSGSSR